MTSARPRPTDVSHRIAGLRVGVAQDPSGTTGVTVLRLDAGAAGAVDARGGAVSAREHDALSAQNAWGELDALVFAGGSTLGLAAADGVADRIWAARARTRDPEEMPVVVGSVIYDFDARDTDGVPDAGLGAAAWDDAQARTVPVGRVGAGTSASVGTYFGAEAASPSGQGAHFVSVGGVSLLAIAVVNALGNVRDGDGRLCAGFRPTGTGVVDVHEHLLTLLDDEATPPRPASRNTTLVALVTDVALERHELSRLAGMCTAGVGHVIEPYATPEDGDVTYALTTAARRLPASLTVGDVGVLAARACQMAVWSAVWEAA